MRNLLLGLVLGITWTILMLSQGGEDFPDAVTADPDHYRVSFENDVIRVLRVRYGPREAGVMHRHWANCTIFLTDQTFNFTVPDGSGGPSAVPAGALGCGDGNVHRPENIETEAAEFIMVELKGRDTFR